MRGVQILPAAMRKSEKAEKGVTTGNSKSVVTVVTPFLQPGMAGIAGPAGQARRGGDSGLGDWQTCISAGLIESRYNCGR
jgi:hypothetical protein